MIDVTCPECNWSYEVDDDLGGKGILLRQVSLPLQGAGVRVAPEPAPPPQQSRAPEPEEEGVGYRCPYCGTRKKWVVVWRRTLLARVLFFGTALACVGLLVTAFSWILALGAAGLPTAILALLAGLVVVAPVLAAAWKFLREEAQVCPGCRTRIAG